MLFIWNNLTLVITDKKKVKFKMLACTQLIVPISFKYMHIFTVRLKVLVLFSTTLTCIYSRRTTWCDRQVEICGGLHFFFFFFLAICLLFDLQLTIVLLYCQFSSMQSTERGRKINAAVMQTGKYVMQTSKAVGKNYFSSKWLCDAACIYCKTDSVYDVSHIHVTLSF